LVESKEAIGSMAGMMKTNQRGWQFQRSASCGTPRASIIGERVREEFDFASDKKGGS
jgi:hypothetical protein